MGDKIAKVYRLTVANVTREAVLAACKLARLDGATIFQGSGYCAEYANGATEYSFTVETVCTLPAARRFWVAIARTSKEDSVYVTVDGANAALWYASGAVIILSTKG